MRHIRYHSERRALGWDIHIERRERHEHGQGEQLHDNIEQQSGEEFDAVLVAELAERRLEDEQRAEQPTECQQVRLVLPHCRLHRNTQRSQGGLHRPARAHGARRTQLRGHLRSRERHAGHWAIRRPVQAAREDLQHPAGQKSLLQRHNWLKKLQIEHV